MRLKKVLCAFTAFVCALLLPAATALADDDIKEIKSISIQIKVKIEAGDTLPELGIGRDSGENYVAAGSTQIEILEADWVGSTSASQKIGDEPRIKLLITPMDDWEYEFKSSYTSSAFKVSGGKYVSSRKDGGQLEVVVKTNPIKGAYMEPEDAGWDNKKMGMAVWKKSDDGSSAYDVELYRGNKKVFSKTELRATTYNLYPYMTVEGDYHFRVRSVPYTESDKKNAQKSEWVESNELHIDVRDVSDGTGQETKSSKNKKEDPAVGFEKENGVVYYKRPDGSYIKDDWLNLDGKWFLFDRAGAMLTGWQQRNGHYYHFDNRGEADKGWRKIDKVTYYFRPDGSAGPECSMVTGWQLIEGRWYFFADSGAMRVGWVNSNGKWYYLNELENELYGSMLKGWLNRNQTVYYLFQDGSMAEGWTIIEGKYYYFAPGNGAMATEKWIDGFYLNEYGIWEEGKKWE